MSYNLHCSLFLGALGVPEEIRPNRRTDPSHAELVPIPLLGRAVMILPQRLY